MFWTHQNYMVRTAWFCCLSAAKASLEVPDLSHAPPGCDCFPRYLLLLLMRDTEASILVHILCVSTWHYLSWKRFPGGHSTCWKHLTSVWYLGCHLPKWYTGTPGNKDLADLNVSNIEFVTENKRGLKCAYSFQDPVWGGQNNHDWKSKPWFGSIFTTVPCQWPSPNHKPFWRLSLKVRVSAQCFPDLNLLESQVCCLGSCWATTGHEEHCLWKSPDEGQR